MPSVDARSTIGQILRAGSRAEHPGQLAPMAETRPAKLELVVPVALIDLVVDTIRRTAHTGQSGDRKVLVIPVDSATRINTAEKGDLAI